MRYLLAAVVLLTACQEAHFCASDVECKGDRICRRSECVDPGDAGMRVDLRTPRDLKRCECVSHDECNGQVGPMIGGVLVKDYGKCYMPSDGVFPCLQPHCSDDGLCVVESINNASGNQSFPDGGACAR